MLRHSHGAESNHLPDDFVDDNALRIMSPERLDALRCKNAREKKKKYSMREVCPHFRRIHQQIKENADSRPRGSGSFGEKAGSARGGDEDRQAVSRRLRASHSIGGLLQEAFPEWEFESRRRPSGRGRSICTARCRTAGKDFPRRQFPSGRWGTSCGFELSYRPFS